jgi:hypothetical protein
MVGRKKGLEPIRLPSLFKQKNFLTSLLIKSKFFMNYFWEYDPLEKRHTPALSEGVGGLTKAGYRHKVFSMTQRNCNTGGKVFLIFIGLFLFIPSYKAFSCTLFGAIGDRVEGGGVLIGKTRDRPKGLEQVFIEVLSKSGYGYRGISLKGVRNVTSGMNEKGLIVVSAAASNVEREDKITTVGRILSQAASVDEVIVLVQRGEIRGPIHYLVGDIHKIALLEVIDGRRYEFLVKENGTLCHTNHFILEEMKKFNPKIGVSSRARLDRIENLLSAGSFTRDKFIAYTRDHLNGPGNNSICRHFQVGARSGERTVSAAVYYLPKDAAPEIWVSLGQPCQSMFSNQLSTVSRPHNLPVT